MFRGVADIHESRLKMLARRHHSARANHDIIIYCHTIVDDGANANENMIPDSAAVQNSAVADGNVRTDS